MAEIILIAAMDENNVIGKDNKIPWYIKEDFQHFKQLTSGWPIIMGRKTWDSLPKKPLPNRENIVLSRTDFQVQGAKVFTSIDDALNDFSHYEKNYIIGGSMIYNLMMSYADKLEITKIHATYNGDAFFPNIDENIWQVINQDDRAGFSFLTYVRK